MNIVTKSAPLLTVIKERNTYLTRIWYLILIRLNNYYLFNEGIELWQNYNKFWIQSYFDFFNGYRKWAKKWLFDVNIPTSNFA